MLLYFLGLTISRRRWSDGPLPISDVCDVISAVLFRTRLRRTHMVALLITYLGMAVVFHQERALSGSDTQKGALLVLGCSVGYAAYLVGAGRLIPRVGAQRFNAYSLLSATTAILLHWTLRGSPLHVMERLFLATISFEYSTVEARRWKDMAIAPEGSYGGTRKPPIRPYFGIVGLS